MPDIHDYFVETFIDDDEDYNIWNIFFSDKKKSYTVQGIIIDEENKHFPFNLRIPLKDGIGQSDV